MIIWNLEHGHKNRLLLMVVFFPVKIVKDFVRWFFFPRNLETQILNLHVLHAKRRKKISECVATSNQFESESSIQIIAESAKVLIQPEFFFGICEDASLNFK